MQCEVDSLDRDESNKWSCAATAIVRVSLRAGNCHEDLGFGNSTRQPSKCVVE